MPQVREPLNWCVMRMCCFTESDGDGSGSAARPEPGGAGDAARKGAVAEALGFI
ncbi:MAG: hypothetical protein ACLTV6_09490 [Christensenellales bacterium]